MANNHKTLKELFDGIADAIRNKTGSTAKIKADNFPSAINAIESGSGGITPSGTITLIENGKHDVTHYEYAEVAVPTSGGGCDHTEVEQATPSIEVSSGGRITVTSTQKAGLVSGGTTTAEKQLTTIGYKLICPGKDNITVVGAGRYTTGDIVVEGNGNLEPYNIKKGITIFDVTGTLDGADFNVDALSELHAWYKSTIAGTVMETDVTDVLLCNATSVSSFQKVDYADSYQIVNNVFSLVNPVNHTLTSSSSTLNAIKGKYIYSYRTEKYYFIPSDAKVSYKSGTPYHSVTVDKATQLTYTGADGSIVGIVVSDNSSAYPQNGSQGGYMYEYIGVLGEQVSDPVLQTLIVDPKTTQQIINPESGYDGFSKVTVNAMPTATQATPSISVNSSGLITASATQTAGYVSAGTKYATKQLDTQAAAEITPSTSTQTAVAAGKFTTGAVTVKGDTNLVAGNIKKGVSIFGVTGNVVEANLQTKTVTPERASVTYHPNSPYVGFENFTVEGDVDLVESNIKKGVTIFGVTGTYSRPSITFANGVLSIR